MGASKPSSTASTHMHAHLTPTTKHIPRSTILKKWKPLPAHSQEKVRQILLNLKTKRSGAGGNGRIPPLGKKARMNGGKSDGKVSRTAVAEEEYEEVVEDVAQKYVNRFPAAC